MSDDQDPHTYKVLINHEGIYTIFYADREPPPDWKEVGKQGTKQECLDYIREVWTDAR